MFQPVQDIVNTSEDTILTTGPMSNGPGGAAAGGGGGGLGLSRGDRQGLITVCMERRIPNESWGFRLQGGKDRGLAFQLLKVPLNSLAGTAGCRSGDYLVKIAGQDVFNLTHDAAKKLIKEAGNTLTMVVERGDHIVPSMNEAFPNHKKKEADDDAPKKEKPYYQRQLEETGELPGQKGKGFTTVGKPKMATKQYNSPLEIYGEEALEEVMQQGTLFGKEIDVMNPWNMTGKQLDLAKSEVLSHIMGGEVKAADVDGKILSK